MAILLTGGCGYIGSHCVIELLRNGIDVIIADSLENSNIKILERLKKINFSGKIIDFFQIDLKSFSNLEKIFKQYNIEAVFNLASYINVEESVKNPEKYYKNNILIAVNILKAMRKFKVKKLIFSSTAAVYGEPKSLPIKENHPLSPINPYGKSKKIIEKLIENYDKKFGIKSVIFRFFNVIGANSDLITGENHEPETHIVPCILKSAIENGRKFFLYGSDYETKDGTTIRDYIDVEDIAVANVLAFKYLNKINKSECFNLGSKNGTSTKEIFDICEKVTLKKINYEYKPRRKGDCAVLLADGSKAKKILGWTPQKNLEKSIKTAFEWEKFKNNL